MKLLNTLSLGGMLLFAGFSTYAVEKTGGEFHEIIQEMNEEISETRKKIEAIEKGRSQVEEKASAKTLKKRAEKIKELDAAVQKMNKAKTSEDRKAASKAVEEKVTSLAETSTEYLEQMKKDLLFEDQQMEVMSDVLSGIIYKLDQLDALAAKKVAKQDAGSTEEQKAQIKNVAKMVDMLSQKVPGNTRWNGVRQTLLLQHKTLKAGAVNGEKLRVRLKEQKKAYEQALAQVAIARQKIASDKELLAQVALGEVAQSALRRTAALLVGDLNIEKLGVQMIEKSQQRQESLVSFIDQSEGSNALSVSESVSDEMPSGWADLLE